MFRIFCKSQWLKSINKLIITENINKFPILFYSNINNPSTSKSGGRKPTKNVMKLIEVPEERRVFVKLLDVNGKELGIMKKSDARNLAFNKEMTLIEIQEAKKPTEEEPDTKKGSQKNKPRVLDVTQISFPTDEEKDNLEICQLVSPDQVSDIRKDQREQRKSDRISTISGESLFK